MQVAAKIFTAISLTLEILLLILRVFYEAGYAIFRKFVPFEERPVVGEIVLVSHPGTKGHHLTSNNNFNITF